MEFGLKLLKTWCWFEMMHQITSDLNYRFYAEISKHFERLCVSFFVTFDPSEEIKIA